MSTKQHFLVILTLSCLLWLGVYGSLSAFAGQTLQAEETQSEIEAKAQAEAQTYYTATVQAGQASNEFITVNGALTSTIPLSLPQLADLSPEVFQIGEAELALLYVQDKTLFRLDLPQQQAQPMAKVTSKVQLSPDGRYLAYDDDSGLHVLDTKSGEIVQLLEHVKPTQATQYDPTIVVHFSPAGWSPQNALLVEKYFYRGSYLGDWIIVGEKTLRPLAQGTACGQAVWSPDGYQLAVSDYEYRYTCSGIDIGLTIVDMVNHTAKRIVEQEITVSLQLSYTASLSHTASSAVLDMSWSPTGEWIAFGLEQAGDTLNLPVRLYIVRPDGRDLTLLTNNIAGKVRSPIWASDEMFYFAMDDLDAQVDGIYTYDLTSQTQTRLIAGSDLQPLSLSPGGEFLLYQQTEGYGKAGAWYAWPTGEQQIIPLIAWSAEGPPASLVGWLGGEPGLVSTRTVRIGLHGRNDIDFHELDYQLIQTANIETLKMMSTTRPEVFARLKRDNPELELIVRLYDDRINANGHPTPVEFADKMIPLMQALQPYVTKFEVGNEPNHFQRYEGWGPEDADAESFEQWFLEVYDLLKTAHPWAELGFPALGTPDSVHRDRAWLELSREAIERADWLGMHCYWQTRPDGTSTMFDEERGLCFKYYHEKFPNKPLELTEFDNDNVIWNIPPLSPEEIAAEYVTYYQELFKYPYLRSASSFIMSSPDRRWEYFVWRTEDGAFKPVVAGIAEMPRPLLVR